MGIILPFLKYSKLGKIGDICVRQISLFKVYILLLSATNDDMNKCVFKLKSIV